MNKIIALNGWPKAGKSEIARILVEQYGAVIVDDGEILRKAAPILFQGIDPEDCYTQEGKDKIVEINGTKVTVRQALGFLGDVLEQFYGEDYIPDQTVKRIATLPDARYFVLPSVRKGQGHFYKRNGGVVFEVQRSGIEPSPNAFDKWDHGAVDWVIGNYGTVADLEREVQKVMHRQFKDAGFTRLLAA